MHVPLFIRAIFAIVLLSGQSGIVNAAEASDASLNIDPDHAAKRTAGIALFKTRIRSVLKDKCLHCHGGDSIEGKLDLSTQEGLFKGGERGPAVVIARGEKSLLTRLVSHRQEPHMPKDDSPLEQSDVDAIVKWIDLGAPYDEPLLKKAVDPLEWTRRKSAPASKQFWSFQPLQLVKPSAMRAGSDWGRSPIDDFILEKLNAARISPNASVGPLASIRRIYFDLIGLPPLAEDLAAFLADERPDAYERWIDQLLANPHYGERWGRHWLDLARFAESHGFEHDYDRPSAFHYRDFVVQALNDGMPYDQFVRWQIAGDEVAPHDRLAQMATGYLAAGVHSTQITKNEVEKHRYDEMDDMLATIGTSLLGLTIGCARCHDHKFDAIPQADYYRLLSTFTTTIRSEVELDFDPEGYQRAKSIFDREHQPYEQAVSDYEIRELPRRFAEWHAKGDAAEESSHWVIPAGIRFTSQPTSTPSAVFTEQPDNSWIVTGPNPPNDLWTIRFETKLTGIRSIRLEALADPSLPRSGPGRAPNGNFALSDLQIGIQPSHAEKEAASIPIKLSLANATFEQNGLPVAAVIDTDPGSAWAVDPEFGKNHAAVFSTTEPFGFEQGTVVTVTLKFNTNVNHSIGRPRLSISSHAELPATIGGARTEAVATILRRPLAVLTDDQRALILNWFKPQDPGWKALDDQCALHAATMPKPRVQKVLVATEGLPPVKLHTQAEAEFLPETHFLRRGETNHKDAVATQSFLQVLMSNPESPQIFQSVPPTGWRTSYRRASLTNWLIDREAGAGHLLARVIVNRLWQHHLGRGIVATASDFGTRGELPTHPELLDWLAGELVQHRWELKAVHRQILSSSTYRQSCDVDEVRANSDRENKLIWHRPRRRLDAEVIRDSILAISGQLNDRLFGPGQLDENHRRRSLYFTVKRSQLVPSMTVFDAPDGTTPVAERPQTTIAPQALLLLNNPHVREASRLCALHLLPTASESLDAAIRQAYLSTIGRPPTPEEQAGSVAFVQQQRQSYSNNDAASALLQSLSDFYQVLFCLNEFVYVE